MSFVVYNSLDALGSAEVIDKPTVGETYSDGIYMYVYGGYFDIDGDKIIEKEQNGWGVQLENRESTTPITQAPLNYIKGCPVVNTNYMFAYSSTESINFSNKFHGLSLTEEIFLNNFGRDIINMKFMFLYSEATTINLPKGFGSNAINLDGMFSNSAIETLYFPDKFGSKATDMSWMFENSKVTTLTFPAGFGAKAFDIGSMFAWSKTTTIILPAGFGANATDIKWVFLDSKAITGYVATQEEADKWNNRTTTITKKPAELIFTVKP